VVKPKHHYQELLQLTIWIKGDDAVTTAMILDGTILAADRNCCCNDCKDFDGTILPLISQLMP
jgi:hypothetical protein